MVSPGRRPWSTSAQRTLTLRVSLDMPSFSAVEVMTGQSEGYSSRCSTNIRTAHSRTPWAGRDYLGIAPSAQRRMVTCLVPILSCVNTGSGPSPLTSTSLETN